MICSKLLLTRTEIPVGHSGPGNRPEYDTGDGWAVMSERFLRWVSAANKNYINDNLRI